MDWTLGTFGTTGNDVRPRGLIGDGLDAGDQFRLRSVVCNGLLATRADTQVRPDKTGAGGAPASRQDQPREERFGDVRADTGGNTDPAFADTEIAVIDHEVEAQALAGDVWVHL